MSSSVVPMQSAHGPACSCCTDRFSYYGLLMAVMMAAVTIPEILVNFYRNTEHNIPEDCHLDSPCVCN
jgi:hypothetical protein